MGWISQVGRSWTDNVRSDDSGKLDLYRHTGKSKEEILEETFHDGFIVVSESADGAFKVEGGQLFKPVGDKVDDLTECRRLRERFGPISACVEYIKDVIMGSGFDIIVDDFHDERQRKIQKQMLEWMDTVYQDALYATICFWIKKKDAKMGNISVLDVLK